MPTLYEAYSHTDLTTNWLQSGGAGEHNAAKPVTTLWKYNRTLETGIEAITKKKTVYTKIKLLWGIVCFKEDVLSSLFFAFLVEVK